MEIWNHSSSVLTDFCTSALGNVFCSLDTFLLSQYILIMMWDLICLRAFRNSWPLVWGDWQGLKVQVLRTELLLCWAQASGEIQGEGLFGAPYNGSHWHRNCYEHRWICQGIQVTGGFHRPGHNAWAKESSRIKMSPWALYSYLEASPKLTAVSCWLLWHLLTGKMLHLL